MNGKDFTCDMDCPAEQDIRHCCRNCSKTRADFVTDETRKYWTDELGFWNQDGCRLPRELMPIECRVYNCKMFHHIVEKAWSGHWVETQVTELKPGQYVRIETREGSVGIVDLSSCRAREEDLIPKEKDK